MTTAGTTQSDIGRAAVGVFAARGYSAATLAQVGAEVGLTRGAVLHHFHSKENLLGSVVAPYRRALAGLASGAGTEEPPTDGGCRQVLVDLVDLLLEHRDAVRVLSADVAARRRLGLAEWPAPPAAVAALLGGRRPTPLTRLRVAAVFGALTNALVGPGLGLDPAVIRQELLAVSAAILDREPSGDPARRTDHGVTPPRRRAPAADGPGGR